MPYLEATLIFVTLILAVIFTVVVVKVGVSFNVNEFSKERRKRAKERLTVLCAHAVPGGIDGNDLMIESLMTSPFGTTSWVCSRCGMVAHDRSTVERMMKQYADNPMALLEQEKRFQKYARKYYRL